MPTLNGYNSIENHLFVRIEVDYYKSSSSSSPISTVLRFSDRRTPFVINGETYTGLGNLVSITSSSSELRTSSGELSISISGIPNSSIYEIVNSRIKGCPVTIYRGIFNPVTGELLGVENNPMSRYKGFVNNYSLQENYDIDQRLASNTIVLICNSSIDVLQNKVTGRTTSPTSQKKFYPSDISMDRVTNLENATFNFGAS